MQLQVLSVLCLHLIAVGIAALVRLRGQKIINFGEGRPPIEIVRIDDSKRAVHHALAAGQRMAGTPWPGASGRDGNALRQTLQFLKDIGDMEIPLHTVADALPELRFHLALDDEHHVAEARAPCVKQGKINEYVLPDRPARSA